MPLFFTQTCWSKVETSKESTKVYSSNKIRLIFYKNSLEIKLSCQCEVLLVNNMQVFLLFFKPSLRSILTLMCIGK